MNNSQGVSVGDLDALFGNDFGQANRAYANDGFGGFTDSGQTLDGNESYGVSVGDVDILDALRVAQIAAGLIIPTPIDFQVCGVGMETADIDIVDALTIAQFAAGFPVTLNCP